MRIIDADALIEFCAERWIPLNIDAVNMQPTIQPEHFMPSARPEPLTDKEQRIFLAAMGREEKVCRQVDEECRDCREPYEDSLVWICHEITRKVKGALWI